MISVERIMEYGQLESEADLIVEQDKQIDSDWPTHGKITASNIYMKYNGSDKCVLNNIHFEINAGEKVNMRSNHYCYIHVIIIVYN